MIRIVVILQIGGCSGFRFSNGFLNWLDTIRKMKLFSYSVSVVLFISSILLGYRICKDMQLQQELTSDLNELTKAKYGIFNMDEWKHLMADIVTAKIENFNLESDDRLIMKTKVTELIYKFLQSGKEAFYEERRIRYDHDESGIEQLYSNIKNTFQTVIADAIDIFDVLEQKVPEMADQFMGYMEREENRENLRGYILEQINADAAETFSEVDYTQLNEILLKYGSNERTSAIEAIRTQVTTIDHRVRPFVWGMVGVLLLAMVVMGMNQNLQPFQVILFAGLAGSFLILGLLMPMIEIDARITDFSFSLLGEQVTFSDQVLYYKSKSIIEVVQLLFQQRDIEIIGVGVLVLLFSVLFPLAKLVATVFYSLVGSVRSNPFVKFLVFQSGKWAMADVFVIAIFIAYIGFDAIITDQISQLGGVSRDLDIMTTYQSSLQLGFYFFTGFVLLSIVLSQKIRNQVKA